MRGFYILLFLTFFVKADSNNQIYVDSKLGIVTYYKNGRAAKIQNLTDKNYRDAVLKNELHIFWNFPELKTDVNQTFPLPVRVAGFKPMGYRFYSTSTGAYKEWAAYFAGDLTESISSLNGDALFAEVVRRNSLQAKFSDEAYSLATGLHGALTYKLNSKYSTNVNEEYLSAWFKKFYNIRLGYGFRVKDSLFVADLVPGEEVASLPSTYRSLQNKFDIHYLTKHLLLGHGLTLTSRHRMNKVNIVGTDSLMVYAISKMDLYKGELYSVDALEFKDNLMVYVPLRDSTGKVRTNLRESLNVAMPAARQQGVDNSLLSSSYVVTVSDLKKTPLKYQDKEVLLIGKLEFKSFPSTYESSGMRVSISPMQHRQDQRFFLKFQHFLL